MFDFYKKVINILSNAFKIRQAEIWRIASSTSIIIHKMQMK